VEILEKAKETLTNTKGDDFYSEHDEYIEEVHSKLDEDSRIEFKTFRADLYQERRIEISHNEELQEN